MDSIADEAVVSTNDDASICKYQAVLKGYYSDPFIEKFIPHKAKQNMPRKAPEINRGYFARSVAIAFIVEQFIKKNPHGQIISLGAGYDTLYWRLMAKRSGIDCDDALNKPFVYVEIDMSTVVMHKLMTIRRYTDLAKHLSSIKYKGEALHSDYYHLISFDLRQVDKLQFKNKLFVECQLDIDKPTLCLAECVLVYMPLNDSNSLLGWLSKNFKDLTVVNYEQCNMKDRFGEIMLENMTARRCDLMGVDACESLDSQRNRFKSAGLSNTKGWTLSEILNNCLLPGSVERVFSIEFLDEKELLEQLLDHYCIVIGSHNKIDWVPEDQYWESETTSLT